MTARGAAVAASIINWAACRRAARSCPLLSRWGVSAQGRDSGSPRLGAVHNSPARSPRPDIWNRLKVAPCGLHRLAFLRRSGAGSRRGEG